MDSMSEGIILIDWQGNILSVNKSAAAIFDKADSFDSKNILELIRDIELMEHVRDALGGNRGEMNIQRSGKSYRVFFSPVKGSGAIILFLDVTEKMIGEKLRREFSANVSHELRTPLTSIYGNAEMLYGGMIQESDQRRFLGKIKDEAARMIALIEDIILVSELDESTGEQVFEDVNLDAVASTAVDALALKAAENKISVEISGKGAVSANPSMMYEMFYNLIDNAIKYNRPGGTVKIDIAKEANHMRISVTDTGIGIPKEAQSRVFERFYRVEKSRSKKTGGTGLGLAIVKHIVRIHRGEIILQSHSGEGTVVTILLPSL
jgi:two-component system phosphate regulon sensor histidine kinase PhoR